MRFHVVRVQPLGPLLAAALLLAGCTAVSPSDESSTEEVSLDSGGVDTAAADAPVTADGSVDGSDVTGDLNGADGTSTWEPCPAGGSHPGCPCDDNDACDSGWCVEGPNGLECTASCETTGGCPDGYACRQIGSGAGDPVFVCLFNHTFYCAPCSVEADCAPSSLSVSPHRCLDRDDGDGSFCATSCSGGGCPNGATCETVTVGGDTLQLCRPTSGTCDSCTAAAANVGSSTPCTRSNGFGVCEGSRACSVDGLSECDAAVPAVEACNGVDDDCNGATDELPDDVCDNTNAFGSCSGVRTCTGGAWTSCNAPPPAAEVCDCADNNCDGLTDEGFPDTDGDGLRDCCDGERDGDGIDNEDDNCPDVANEFQEDTDSDGEGDACDADCDNDGVLNEADCGVCDSSITNTTYYWDGDGDGYAVCNISQKGCAPQSMYTQTSCSPEDCMDSGQDAALAHPTGEEVCDGLDNDCDGDTDEGFTNTDGDEKADCQDPDDDNDVVLDQDDNCPLVANADQADLDSDDLGDACDPDDDGDGVDDVTDCAPLDGAVSQLATEVCNGIDDNCNGDTDEDFGVGGPCDSESDPDSLEDDSFCCKADGTGVECCDGLAEAACNGIDDDDDGYTDEGWFGVGDPCDDVAANPCSQGTTICTADGGGLTCFVQPVAYPDGLDGTPTLGDACDGDDLDSLEDGTWSCLDEGTIFCDDADDPEGGPDLCDGIDNDDDGFTDEGYVGIGEPCATGDCAGGLVVCTADHQALGCTFAGAVVEICNGLDDDCDGLTDEDPVGVGEPCDGDDDDSCKGGSVLCVDGSPTCSESPGAGVVEICNGLDDDCDGFTDEDYPEAVVPCDGDDPGSCAGGSWLCSASGELACDEPLGAGETEICNGLDDDCDGDTDESFPEAAVPCDGDDPGSCANGTWVCSPAGELSCDEALAPGETEICNGLDDDCDGDTDESFPEAADPCDGDDAGDCATGAWTCTAAGELACDEVVGAGDHEVCNGVDDDCDGDTDEEFPEQDTPCDGPDPGLCATGMTVCDADGELACDEALTPGNVEDCSTQEDDDCDGTPNQGCVPASVEITFHSFVLPYSASAPAAGHTYGVAAAGGEAVVGNMAAQPGGTYSVQLGFYPVFLAR